MKKITLCIITIFSLMLTSAYGQEASYSVNTQIVCAGGETVAGTSYSVSATAVGEAIGENSLGATYDILGGFIPTITDFSRSAGLMETVGSNKVIKFPAPIGETETQVVISTPEVDTPTSSVDAPARPTLNPVISPTNINTQEISGTKAKNTWVWLNDKLLNAGFSETVWGPKTLNLQYGDNPIVIYSTDKNGNRSLTTIEENIIYDNLAPVIVGVSLSDISSESPQDQPYTNKPSIDLSGTITDITAVNIKVSVMNESGVTIVYELKTVPEDPNFSTEISLSEGQNTITIQATDEVNQESSQQVSIYLDTQTPATPTFNYITPTYITTQELNGTKEADTSIWINGQKVISNGSATTWKHILSLSEGNNSFSVTAKDRAANESAAKGIDILLDTTAPSVPVVIDEGDYRITKEEQPQDTLQAVWQEAVDNETGITQYQYAIGTTPGASDITAGWISIGLATEVSYHYNYAHRGNYYFSVKAINAAGNSSEGYSDGIIVNHHRPMVFAMQPSNYSVYTAGSDKVEVYCKDYAEPDNDPLKFRFLISGVVVDDWNSENYYLWIPQKENEGFNTLTVELQDDLSGQASISVQVYIAVPPPGPPELKD